MNSWEATIRQEARALNTLTEQLDHDAISGAVELLASVSRVICTGVGKSGHVARKVASTMASVGTAALYLHPVEAAHGDLGIILPDDGVFALSKSGHTTELEPVIDYAATLGCPVVLMSENGADGLAVHANVVLRIPTLLECWGRAPTVSSIMQMALGDAIAVALAERKQFTPRMFKRLHPGGVIGRAA